MLDGHYYGGKGVVAQHEGGGFGGHLGATLAHGHADVGLFEGGRVVHAVANHGHDVALALVEVNQVELLGGADAGKHADFLQAFGGLGVGQQLGQFRTRYDGRVRVVGRGQMHLAGHGEGGGGVVAGYHQHPDAGLLAGFDGRNYLGPGGVEEGHEAQQNQVVGEVGGWLGGRVGRGRAVGQGQGAKAGLGQLLGALQPLGLLILRELLRAFGVLLLGAKGQHGFDGPFHGYPSLGGLPGAGGQAVLSSHEACIGVEGLLGQAFGGLGGGHVETVLVGQGQQRHFEWVAEGGGGVSWRKRGVVAEHGRAEQELVSFGYWFLVFGCWFLG